jgi:hypothetical protein
MNQIFDLIIKELAAADHKYPPMAEAVEGLHTIKCELAELEREIMRKGFDQKAMTKEGIQVAAMAVKFLRDCCYLWLPEKAQEPLEVRIDTAASTLSLRGQDWLRFSQDVLSHIEEYTVPQYGDRGKDRATNYTTEVIADHIGRYKDRMGSNARGEVEAKRDLMKIAHYASLAHQL